MKPLEKYLIFAILMGLASWLVACTHAPAIDVTTISGVLARHDLTAQLGDRYELRMTAHSKIENTTVESYEFQSFRSAARLNLKITQTSTPLIAERLLQERLAKIHSIYDPHLDPYFAILTQEITCPDSFKPQTSTISRKTGELFLFLMFATQRNTFGACSRELAEKRAIAGYFICRTRLIEIEKFVPRDQDSGEDLKEVSSFDCLS